MTVLNYPLISTLEKIVNVLNTNFSDVFLFEHHNSNEDLKEEIEKLLTNNLERMKDFYKIAKALVQ